MVKRTWYQDCYNEKKTWEVVKINGAYYLRQYINERQFGRGLRTTKKYLESTGILEFEKIR